VLGPIKELGGLIGSWKVNDVFVASERLDLHQELNLLASEERWPVDFHVVSQELEPFAQRVPLGRVVELPLLQLPHVRADSWYEATKRLFDLLFSSIGLLVLLPLLGVIALVIKLESGGPALFVQQRIGLGSRSFRMYKFRTMSSDAPAYDLAPNDLTDPRVTPFGRFLRRWSLDELPQLLNVCKGQMSVVGPRPEMPFLVSQYELWEKRRLMVKPGLTCLWQVVGRKELPLHRNIEYDLYYVRHRGWLLDAVILLRTIPAVLFRRGAF
jgi:lipopolysaccharide/colanic/teichoic acid biosynthesis glycosyltransferase